MMMTPENITNAVRILSQGGLVAFPTETVYGLGADASNEMAVRRIFQAKERPADHPVIVHISHLNQLQDWAENISPEVMTLAQAFWPGPLTMILKKRPDVLGCLTGGQDTIGIRIPKHPVALALLEAFGGGLAAPSANKFTRISPTTATAVREELGESVDFILDGGACEVGLESTIIDMSQDEPVILRPGIITAAKIASVLGKSVSLSKRVDGTRAPGRHILHYAPKTKAQLVKTDSFLETLHGLKADDLPVVCLAYSDTTLPHVDNVFWVEMPRQAPQYGHDLYRTLRALDSQNYRRILIEAVPEELEWDAIRDRLFKACGSVV